MANEAADEENKLEEVSVQILQAPDDDHTFEYIEKVASVVAWTPSAELFFMKIMQGNQQFDFMTPANAYHAYYLERIEVLRLRPCPLYSILS